MKPTNDERRYCAQMLRAIKWRDYAELAEKIEDAVGCDIGQDWQDMDVADRLAELIEPNERTCRPVARYHDDDSSQLPHYACSECGESLQYRDIVTDYGEESCEMLPYCAGCGAKVVDE